MSSVEERQLLEEPVYRSLGQQGLDAEHPAVESPSDTSNNDRSANSLEQAAGNRLPSLPRSLTYLNGLALVLGLQIGSGIFSVPAAVRTHVSSSAAAILVWILAGVLVWTGAATFIELGTRVPQNGGIQEYLRHCYGDIYGFLFACIWILVTRPCAMAMIALVFSEYLFKAVLPDQDVPTWILKVVALLAIASITYLNCISTRAGTGAANYFLILKVFGLGSIAIVGLTSALTGFTSKQDNHPSNGTEHGSYDVLLPAASHPGDSWLWMSLGNFADAVLAALFAYAGWESISFVIGEMKEPHYTLPRVLNSSMAIVITLFVLTNLAFYITLPLEVLQKTNAVAIEFGTEIFGRPGALFYIWIVSLSCLGALNAVVFSAGRLTQAAGVRHYLPAFLETAADSANDVQRDDQGQTSLLSFYGRRCPFPSRTKGQNIPINAMVLNGSVAAVYVLLGSFRGLLSFKGMVEYVVYFTTVSGLLLLRFRSRFADKEPPIGLYHTSIFNPLIFCCVTALVVIRSAVAHVLQALIIIALFGVFSLVYQSRWWQKLVRTAAITDSN